MTSEGLLKKKVSRIRSKIHAPGGEYVCVHDVYYKIDEAKKDMDYHKHRLDAHPLFFGGAFVLIPLKKWTKWFGSEETQ